jgi:hypothetical protein
MASTAPMRTAGPRDIVDYVNSLDNDGHLRLREAGYKAFAMPTPVLMQFASISAEPMLAWYCNWLLSRRGVPPCLRPKNHMIQDPEWWDWLGDFEWIKCRYPFYIPSSRSLEGIFSGFEPPISNSRQVRWHREVLALYTVEYSSVDLMSRMGLTDPQQRELNALHAPELKLSRQKFVKQEKTVTNQLRSHASLHPDQSGARSIEEIVRDRWRIYECRYLAGENNELARRYVGLITGRPSLSRWAFRNQLTKIQSVLSAGCS